MVYVRTRYFTPSDPYHEDVRIITSIYHRQTQEPGPTTTTEISKKTHCQFHVAYHIAVTSSLTDSCPTLLLVGMDRMYAGPRVGFAAASLSRYLKPNQVSLGDFGPMSLAIELFVCEGWWYAAGVPTRQSCDGFNMVDRKHHVRTPFNTTQRLHLKYVIV